MKRRLLFTLNLHGVLAVLCGCASHPWELPTCTAAFRAVMQDARACVREREPQQGGVEQLDRVWSHCLYAHDETVDEIDRIDSELKARVLLWRSGFDGIGCRTPVRNTPVGYTTEYTTSECCPRQLWFRVRVTPSGSVDVVEQRTVCESTCTP